MPETNYAQLVRDAEDAAALRLRRGVIPPGRRRDPTTGEPSTRGVSAIANLFAPQNAADVAMMAFGTPLARIPIKAGAKALGAAGGALGAMLFPDEAQASFKRAMGLFKAPAVQSSAFDRPLFDYSRLRETPNVPQFDLPRVVPPRGIPERTLALDNPENVARINAMVQSGAKKGGLEWYNTMPLREGYVGELGETKGVPSYTRFINLGGAVSPRSKVPQNVRTASYYQMLDELGLPLPQAVKVGSNWSVPAGEISEGYGGLAQALHAQNAKVVLGSGGWPDETILKNPKPPSFTQNLLGNYRPVTADYLNTRMVGITDAKGRPVDMPASNEYGFSERLQQREAAKLGMEPAQYQASGWIEQAGGGEYSKPFLQVVEDRVKATAREYGMTPEQTLRMFYRSQIPIAFGGVAALPAVRRQGSEALPSEEQ